MKNLKRIFLLALCILCVFGAMPVVASIPYSTYTYDIDGKYMESPHAYVPYEVIDSKTIDLDVPLEDVRDLFVDKAGNVYISDATNKRVVVLNADYSYAYEVSSFVNEWGVPDAIVSPNGICVANDELYITDTDANRLLVFSTQGDHKFIKTIAEPESDVFPEGHIYKPVAVAVGNTGYIYVVSSTTYQGIIAMDGEGKFTGFLGTQTASMTVFDMMWRKFQTAEQRAKSAKNVSTEFNNITIDQSGFLYATTASISEADQMNAITTKSISGTFAPVKKLNPDGADVMNRTGFYPPSGEVTVMNMITPTTNITGPSKIVDVALGPEGMWSIIDEKRQRVYTYDEDGKLLFIFGDKGNQLGNIQSIEAIDYQGTNMLILDKTNDNITVFKRTVYGDVLANALKNQRERIFDAAANDWTNILQRNSNFDMSYVGIGKSLFRAGKYEQAMHSYKYAYDTTNYSEAFQAQRKKWVEKYILIIPIFIILLFIFVSKFFKYAAKVNLKGQVSKKKRSVWEEFLYGFHVIFHPFDGFWDLKHEKRGSAKTALVILAITIVSFIYQKIGRGYLLDSHPTGVSILLSITSVLLPVLLWVVANWCLTTLFDGEGSIKDIFIATCYSLFPLPAFIVITTFASNFVTLNEVSIISLAINIAYFWVGFLIFFGMMVIHDYSLFKNVLTTIGSIVGMAFIMFVGVLFSSLVGKIFSFIYNIYLELSYRV